MQAFLAGVEPVIAELAGVSDLRTLEAANDLTRRIFARRIAEAWAAEELHGRRAA